MGVRPSSVDSQHPAYVPDVSFVGNRACSLYTLIGFFLNLFAKVFSRTVRDQTDSRASAHARPSGTKVAIFGLVEGILA
jgi:hypothetical protein